MTLGWIYLCRGARWTFHYWYAFACKQKKKHSYKLWQQPSLPLKKILKNIFFYFFSYLAYRNKMRTFPLGKRQRKLSYDKFNGGGVRLSALHASNFSMTSSRPELILRCRLYWILDDRFKITLSKSVSIRMCGISTMIFSEIVPSKIIKCNLY